MPGRALNKKPKILYIEDNPENRMLVRAVLEAAGYDLVEAEDGLAGIEAAIREEPALILLDINLPGVDGYEIVAILKSFPNLASTPVIAVTAYAMQGDRQRTLVAGCDGYLQKPINGACGSWCAERPAPSRGACSRARASSRPTSGPRSSGRCPSPCGAASSARWWRGTSCRRAPRPTRNSCSRSSPTGSRSRSRTRASTSGSCAARRRRRASSRPAAS